MTDEHAGEYDLTDVPEPPPKRPVAPTEKPLPRLWKTESDDDEDAIGPRKDKPESADGEAKKSARRSSEVRRRSRTEKEKNTRKTAPATGVEKRVLIEDTPALDTYEARQRARWLVGGLVAACFLIFGYVFYQLFIYDPMRVEPTGDEPPPTVAIPPPIPKRDLDIEARSMLKRAETDAKAGRTKEAVALLENVIKSYRGTKSAAEAKEALERPKHNLPLFLDRPTVKAEQAPPPQPAPAPEPPAIVQAQPRQTKGNATLTLPDNPAELTPSRLSPLANGPAPAPGNTSPARTPIRPLPEGFTASAEAGVHSSGWPLVIIGKRDGAPMMLVPGGTFLVGNDNGPPAEGPAHQVRLSTYYIDQHEVTVRQFQLFLSETHYRGQPAHNANWTEDFRKNPSESLPMVMVNARDAQAYADWALKKLPTEAQWEAAARGGDGRLFPWGSDPKAISRPTGDWKLQPVKATPGDVSPFGVFDMGGNVLEWTRDWYDSRYYHRLPVDGADNPTGPATKPRSLEYVVKGDRKRGSAASRQGIMLEKRLTYVGFRCVLPVPDGPAFMPGPSAPGSVPPGAPPGRPPGTPPGQGNTQPPPVPF
ncbi:MAG: SUMF1/EgtB/PvdO family nonheme iron enzyme [Isosphaeraceae bacterium]